MARHNARMRAVRVRGDMVVVVDVAVLVIRGCRVSGLYIQTFVGEFLKEHTNYPSKPALQCILFFRTVINWAH